MVDSRISLRPIEPSVKPFHLRKYFLREASPPDYDESPSSSSDEDIPDRILRVAPVRKPVKAKTREKPKLSQRRQSARQSMKSRPSPKRRRRDAPESSSQARNARSRPKHRLSMIELPIPIRSTKIPPWKTLPYLIWERIFWDAAWQIRGSGGGPRVAQKWLRECLLISRATAEPVVTALYEQPVLDSEYQISLLVRTLSAPDALYRYEWKIHSLHPSPLLFQHDSQTNTLFDHTPRLTDLQFTLPGDNPRYVVAESLQLKRIYATDLFEHLERGGVHLRTWRWNLKIDGNRESAFYADTHLRSPFTSLKNLSFVNYIGQTAATEEAILGSLTTAINLLPNLCALRFENCPVVGEQFLKELEKPMTGLTFINCDRLSSDILEEYLERLGGALETLILDENRYLSLEFLPNFRQLTPQLKTLHVDLHYSSSFAVSQLTKPLWERLLDPQLIPTWPTTLQEITILYLRKLDRDTTDMFFRSLTDSASSLPDLRKLILIASVDVEWRDRTAFRADWEKQFDKVFKRRTISPNMGFSSTKTRHVGVNSDGVRGKAAATEDGNSTELRRSSRRLDESPANKLSRAGAKRGRAYGSDDSSSDSEDTDDIDDTADEYSDDNLTSTKQVTSAPEHVQGMCNVVDIRIDNQRPAENQFREADFIDTEAEDDDDWDGRDNFDY